VLGEVVPIETDGWIEIPGFAVSEFSEVTGEHLTHEGDEAELEAQPAVTVLVAVDDCPSVRVGASVCQ